MYFSPPKVQANKAAEIGSVVRSKEALIVEIYFCAIICNTNDREVGNAIR